MKKQMQTITKEEARLLLSGLVYLGNTPTSVRRSVRNTCIVLVMLDAGLRVGETVQLVRSDLWYGITPHSNIVVRADIAKTHVERIIPTTERLKRSIYNMQQYVWSEDFENPDPPAFYISHGPRRISVDQVQIFIKQACKLAHIRHINPHMLRHTFATRLMKQTNIRIVQQLLGHASLESTQVYTHPDQEDLEKAIEQMESTTNDKNHTASKTSTPNMAATKGPS